MPKIAFIASEAEDAIAAKHALEARHGQYSCNDADIIVALGGDGLMLQTMHKVLNTGKAVYGMNRGSIGFLMNDFNLKNLPKRLQDAEATQIHPLRMEVTTSEGESLNALAFNEVSLLRQRHQAAKLRISVDDKERMQELICDGLIVATPAGSTAYNLSARGPILPINSPLFALTPLSAFRPRAWRGAILSDEAKITIDILEREKRPVAAVADQHEFRYVSQISVSKDTNHFARLMFDPGHSLAERVLAEQFAINK